MKCTVDFTITLLLFSSFSLSAGSVDGQHPPQSEKVYTSFGGDVIPPKVIYSPNPAYPDKARKAKKRGTVLLSYVVTPEGNVRDVKVIRRLTPELDQKAVEIVSTWRFKPATKKGQPVAAQINTEINFNLY